MFFRDDDQSFWAKKGIPSTGADREPLGEVDGVASITCPRCGRTSYNPNDIREGYCGNCHDWTRSDR
jgi:ribosomal protein L37E